MDNNSKDIHEQNKKRIEYYVNRIQSLNDSGEEIKMVIEDSFENQEKEYDENNKKKTEEKGIEFSSFIYYYSIRYKFNYL